MTGGTDELKVLQGGLNRVIVVVLLMAVAVALALFFSHRSPPEAQKNGQGQVTQLTLPMAGPLSETGSTQSAVSTAAAPAASAPAAPASTGLAVNAGDQPAVPHGSSPVAKPRASSAAAPLPVEKKPEQVAAVSHPVARRSESVSPRSHERVSGPQASKPATKVAHAKVERQPGPSQVRSLPPKGWYVQVGAFADKGNVARVLERLHGKGFAARAVPTRDGKLHRVLVGPVPSQAAAEKVMAKVRAFLGLSGFVLAQR